MAGCDYRSCDVCGSKTFYDANLDYDFKQYPATGLSGVGAWVVLCEQCSEKYDIITVDKE